MDWSLPILFGASFAAATLVPFQSEVVLAALLADPNRSVVVLVAVATVGNTLGSCVNWAMGRGIRSVAHWPGMAQAEATLARAEGWFERYGRWSLLLAWTPFLGDPLCVVAGSLRVPFLPFVLLVGAGKLARYIVVALAVRGLLG